MTTLPDATNTATPASDISVYFDAPSAYMSEENRPAPPANPENTSDGVHESVKGADLHRGPSVAIPSNPTAKEEPSSSPSDIEFSSPPGIHRKPPPPEQELGVNGSEHVDENERRRKASTESAGWLPAVDEPPVSPPVSPTQPSSGADSRRKSSVLKKKVPPSRTASVRSTRSLTSPRSPNGETTSHNHVRAGSVFSNPASTSKRSVFTNNEGRPIDGSSYINGAGVTGPSAEALPDENLSVRASIAEASLSSKQKTKIARNEAKETRRLSKIMKTEAKIEKGALDVAVKELAELQTIQKAAIKREAKAHTAHTKALSDFGKQEAAFLAARAKYETSQAQMNAYAETLEITRANAHQATASMQEKSQEIDALRKMYGVDERERGAKDNELKELKARGKGSGLSRVFGR